MPVKRTSGAPSGAPKRTRFASPSLEAGPSGSSRRDAPRAPSSSKDKRDRSASADDDDQYLDADITESSRNAKKREKRSLRDQEGYGSDSSNDSDEGPRRRGAADEEDEAGEGEEDDDVDMFGDDEPAPKTDAKGGDKGKDKGKGKGEQEFMDLADVEGQEFEQPDNHSNSDEDSDVPSDLDPEERKKRIRAKRSGLDGDMGVDITPFNMKREMDEGRFTADGEAYMENDRDEQEKHDTWLADMDADEIKKARRAHRERERLEREREQAEAAREAAPDADDKENALLRQAVEIMERGETVLEAMQRLGKDAEKRQREMGGKKKSWVERQRERKAAMAQDASDAHPEDPFSKLSNIVSALTANSQLDVYSLSREAIQRMLPREEPRVPSPPRARPPPDTRMFQYRFSMAYMRSLPEGQRPVERELFGPFPLGQLEGWKRTGFFGPDCQNIEIRVVMPNEGDQPWGSWSQVVG